MAKLRMIGVNTVTLMTFTLALSFLAATAVANVDWKADDLSPQLEADIRSQLLLYNAIDYSTESAASNLTDHLSTKYTSVNWMVALYNHECSAPFHQMIETKPSALHGKESGLLVLQSPRWNAVVAWKSDGEIQATPNPEVEIAEVKRKVKEFTSQSHYNDAQTPTGTWVRGIRDAGIFWQAELKQYLFSVRLAWSGVMVVKKECNMAVASSLADNRFFSHFVDGYKCQFKNKPFICGVLLRWGEADIVVFPAVKAD